MDNLTAFERISKTIDKVIYLLNKYPDLRDNDQKLVAYYNWNEIGSAKFKTLSAKGFLDLLIKGDITPAQTILRARRKAQELNEDLRGNNYKTRHKASDEVRNNINNI